MIITDYCKNCGAKFQIDDAAISECKKKNNWNCHCPDCHTYIDVKKYMKKYEFPGTENKNKNDIVNYAFDRNYPDIYKKVYLFFKKLGLFGLIIGIPIFFLAFIMFLINCEMLSEILAFFGMIGLVIALPSLLFAWMFYHKYWFMENFVRLVEKR